MKTKPTLETAVELKLIRQLIDHAIDVDPNIGNKEFIDDLKERYKKQIEELIRGEQ